MDAAHTPNMGWGLAMRDGHSKTNEGDEMMTDQAEMDDAHTGMSYHTQNDNATTLYGERPSCSPNYSQLIHHQTYLETLSKTLSHHLNRLDYCSCDF